MKLRSRLIETPSKHCTTPYRRRKPSTPLKRTELGQCGVHVQPDHAVSQVPKHTPVVQRGVIRKHRRKVVLANDNRKESEFKTPVRVRHRLHASSHTRSPLPINPARNLYLPVVGLLTPTKQDARIPSAEVMSPEPFMFGFDSISPIGEEEDNNDVFSPFTFIKNIPSQSQQTRPVLAARDIPPKTRSTPNATLVLDLDETLVFSSLMAMDEPEHTFETHFQDHLYKVYVVLRPHVKEFLNAMSKIFEMFVYTSAKKEYAEKIVDILDPKKKLFRHRLYQDDCSCVLGHYVKDLRILERDLAKTVILDNAPHTFPYHLMNMIPIKSWLGDGEDQELQRLIPYLEKLVEAEDFRNVLKRRTDHFHRLLSED